MFTGMFILLFAHSTFTLVLVTSQPHILSYLSLTYTGRQGGLKARPRRVVFATTLTSFLLATLYWISELAIAAIQLDLGNMVDSGGMVDHAALDTLNNRCAPLGIIQDWVIQLLVCVVY